MTREKVSNIGVFAFYDKAGIVCDYVHYLLEEVLKIFDEIIIVINGQISYEGIEYFKSISNIIIQRENIGYDASAYKEGIFYLYENNMMEKYDELLIFNNSFFGPFFSMRYFFELDYCNCVDFWGFRRWKSGYAKELQTYIQSHIQSWFVVFNRRLIHSSDFIDFWNTLETCLTYKDAVIKFEANLTSFFGNRGYSWDTYDNFIANAVTTSDKYSSIASDVINFEYPFLKYKQIRFPAIEGIGEILEFLENESLYETKCMWDYLLHRERCGVDRRLLLKLDDFCDEHTNIFIYGNGNYGKMIKSFLKSRGKFISAIVVSSPKDENEKSIREVVIEKNDGIVVAVGKRYRREVEELLKNKYDFSQLFIPDFYGTKQG